MRCWTVEDQADGTHLPVLQDINDRTVKIGVNEVWRRHQELANERRRGAH